MNVDTRISDRNAAIDTTIREHSELGPDGLADLTYTDAKAATEAARNALKTESEAMTACDGAGDGDKAAARTALNEAVSHARKKVDEMIAAQKLANEFATKAGRTHPFGPVDGVRDDYQVTAMDRGQVQALLGFEVPGAGVTSDAPLISAASFLNRDPAQVARVFDRLAPGMVRVNPNLEPGAAGGPARPDAWLLAHAGQPQNSADFANKPFNAIERQFLERTFGFDATKNPNAEEKLLDWADQNGGIAPGSYLAELRGLGSTIPTDSGQDPLFNYDPAKGAYVRNLGMNVGGPYDIWRSTDGNISMTHASFPSADDPTQTITGNFYATRNASGGYDLKFETTDPRAFAAMPKISDVQRAQLLGILTTESTGPGATRDADSNVKVGNRTLHDAGDLAAYIAAGGGASAPPATPPTTGPRQPFTTGGNKFEYTVARGANGSLTIDVARNADGSVKDPRAKDAGFPVTYANLNELLGGNDGQPGLLKMYEDLSKRTRLTGFNGDKYYMAMDPKMAILDDLYPKFRAISAASPALGSAAAPVAFAS